MRELRTYKENDNLEKYGSYIDENIKMNEDFYNVVMRDINTSDTGAFCAFDIYNSLNKRVAYDEVFAVFDQDRSLDFIEDIYNKKVEEITEEENNIICADWADAFAYLLTANGYEAVVNRGPSHNQVFFKAENHIFRADATDKIRGFDEHSQLSDLTRSKLGIFPQGFLIYEENSQGMIEEKNFLQSEFYKSRNRITNSISITDYTMKVLNELKQDEDFYSYEVPKDYENVFSQIALISEMVNTSNLDAIGAITYLKHLMKVLIPEDDRKKITLDHIKIQNEEEEVLDVNKLNYGLILTYMPEEVEEPKCCVFHPSVSGYNFLYTKNSGLAPISEEEAYNLQEKNDDIELKVEEHNYKRGKK